MTFSSRSFKAIITFLILFCSVNSFATSYEEIEWTALMPADDLAALLSPPEYLDKLQDGSQQDSVRALQSQEFKDENMRRFKKALSSTRVIPAFDNRSIRLPGFVVPLQQNSEQLVTEFFIVPYFGACLHMPPPPPNQMIFVSNDKGIALDDLQQAFWFEGKVKIKTLHHSLGTSAYSMELAHYEEYD